MQLVMMGTGPFAVPTFEQLLAGPHDVVCLFTQPQRTGRGSRSSVETPMRDLAARHGLPIHDPQSVNSAEGNQLLAQQNADLLIVCDYGQILASETLALARLGGINLHGSILPKYRGAAPVNWAIFNGDAESGITVIHMTPKLDGGPCLKVVRTPIGPDETAVELERRLSLLGAPAVTESIDILRNAGPDAILGQPQDPSLATRAPRLSKAHGDVDWNRTAQEIYNQFRAFQPWPGCFTHLLRDDKPPLRLILSQIRPVAEELTSSTQPGIITTCEEDNLVVATGQGRLRIERLQPAGKKEMSAAEFIRGNQMREGDQMGPPT